LVNVDDWQECPGGADAELAGRGPGQGGNVGQTVEQLVEGGVAVVDGGAFVVGEGDGGEPALQVVLGF
jgi:hypothetical protein